MPKHKLNDLSKSEAKTYKDSITEWAQPLLTGAVQSVFDHFYVERRHAGRPLKVHADLRVTEDDLEELATAQGIAFSYTKKILATARGGVRDTAGVRIAMAAASESITSMGVQSTIDWDETLDLHWQRVLKRAVSKLVSDVMADAFEKEEEDSSDDEEDESSEEEEEEEEEIEDDSEEEEEDGEEEEAGDEDIDEAKEELEEMLAEAEEKAAEDTTAKEAAKEAANQEAKKQKTT